MHFSSGSSPSGPTASISEVSELLSLPAPTIRSWERRYGFPTPPRTDGSHRRYTVEEIDQLRALRDAIASGTSPRRAVEDLKRPRMSEAEAYVQRFVRGAEELDASAIRRSLDSAKRALDLETAIQEVAMAGMRDVGANWEAGRCDVANEHLASSVTRSWLAAQARPVSEGPGVLLACGPQDAHSIGLEAFGAILTRRGIRADVLGPLTPSTSLRVALEAMKPRAVVITSHQNVWRRSAIRSLQQAAAVPRVKVFYAGNAFSNPASRKLAPGRYLGRELPAAADMIEKIAR